MDSSKRVVVELAGDEVVAERDIPVGADTFRVRFRPVSPVEYRSYQRAAADLDVAGRLEHEYALAARLIQDWQLAAPNGDKLPITPATMKALRPPLFYALFTAVVFDTGATILGNSAAS